MREIYLCELCESSAGRINFYLLEGPMIAKMDIKQGIHKVKVQ